MNDDKAKLFDQYLHEYVVAFLGSFVSFANKKARLRDIRERMESVLKDMVNQEASKIHSARTDKYKEMELMLNTVSAYFDERIQKSGSRASADMIHLNKSIKDLLKS